MMPETFQLLSCVPELGIRISPMEACTGFFAREFTTCTSVVDAVHEEQGMRLHVGNLSFDVGEDALKTLFEPYGRVGAVEIVTDRTTAKSRGFAFVEMPDPAEAQAAIAKLDGTRIHERIVSVAAARSVQARTSGASSPSWQEPRSSGGNGWRRN